MTENDPLPLCGLAAISRLLRVALVSGRQVQVDRSSPGTAAGVQL